MKKILFIAFLFGSLSNYAQNKIAQKVTELQNTRTIFTPISPLSVSEVVVNADVNKVVENVTFATINLSSVSNVVANQYENIALEIPYQGHNITVLLYKVNPFAEGFHVDTNKAKNRAYQKGVYYRGIIPGETNSVAAFNFFNGEFNGVISSNQLGNLVIGKLDKTANTADYIVYSDAEMKVLNQFDCHVKEDTQPTENNNPTHRDGLSDRCVTVYFEIDNDLYVNNGSSETTTTNWMTSVFNNVQTIYNSDGITVSLKSVYIWTDVDPYEGIGTSSSDYLFSFNENRPIFDGDVGQLVGIDPGGLGGVAVTINGLCSQNNFSYSDVNLSYLTVPTYSWTVQVITHELGHLLGSRHTHGCYWNGDNTAIDGCGQQAGYNEGTCADGPIPSTTEKGTIMSYCHLISGVGISFNNGFGPQPSQAILNAVNGGACLSLDCINTCINTISAVYATEITTSSALITWDDASATSWEVSVTPFASSTIVWNTVTTNSYTATGLSANAYYKIRVRPLCPGLTPTNSVKVFATTATNFCSGVPFTDTGGASANYTNMESYVRTMLPAGPGLKIKVTFTSFSLETDYDYLYIYNGSDEFFAELTGGGLTGSFLPGSYTSTAASGALTFKFYSDQALVDTGWIATITCTGTLGEESNDYIDFTYYPNPTNGKVNISSRDEITEISVYNVEGRLLLDNKLNELNTNVDIAQFAAGTYFFKVKFHDKEANFKILKM